MRMLKNQKGFSLIELMIVVAIIGILAAVAIPNYARFQNKAKQSEAKNQLEAIYTTEKAFFAEYSEYNTRFDSIGFRPDGTLAYNTGFSADVGAPQNVTALASFPGTATCFLTGLTLAALPVCAYGGAVPTAQWVPNSSSSNVALPAGNTVAANRRTFQAGSIGNIANSGTNDTWTINDTKALANVTVGVD